MMTVNRLESVRHPDRLAALRGLGLLDTPADEAFDQVTRLAAKLLHAPMAMISLVDDQRQFLKSSLGLPDPWASRREMPLTHSFCWLVVATGEPLAIADAREYPLVADSPATREVGIVAYAGVPLRGPGGHVLGALAVMDPQPHPWTDRDLEILQDLTALLASQLERRPSATSLPPPEPDPAVRARLALLEAIGDGIVAVDRADVCTFVNPAGAQLLGYSPDELVGRSWHETVHHSRPDGSPYPATACPIRRTATTGERCRVEGEVFWRRDLTSVPVTYAAFPLLVSGEPAGAVVVFTEASQHVASSSSGGQATSGSSGGPAEATYQRLAFLARASALLGSSLETTTILDHLTALVVPALADWCAIDLLAADGSLSRAAVAHRDPARAEAVRALWPLVEAGLGPFGRLRNVLRTGQIEHLAEVSERELLRAVPDAAALALLRRVGLTSIVFVPLRAGERVLGVLTLAHGESGRQHRPEDVELAEDLGQRAASALANAEELRKAQEAVRLRNEFLIGISHDLRNPLANIKGFTQLVLRGLRQLEAPQATELVGWLTRIDATTTKMTSLLDELLDVARLQSAQKVELERRPTNLVTLARQVVETYQQTDDRHRIRFETTVPNLVGFWDQRRLERVLANLVANAIKYSPEGGDVTVTVTTEEAGGQGWAIVTVQDQGLGIPARDLPHIFEPFYRGSNVVTRSAGAGVGLATVRQIVELHGGTVSVSSQEGQGSTFTVRLPLPSRPQPAERPTGSE